MAELFRKAVLAGIGLITEGGETVNKFANELVKKGEISQKEAEKLVKDLLKRGDEARKELAARVHSGAEEVLGKADIATKDDIDRLSKKVASLERKIKEMAKTR